MSAAAIKYALQKKKNKKHTNKYALRKNESFPRVRVLSKEIIIKGFG